MVIKEKVAYFIQQMLSWIKFKRIYLKSEVFAGTTVFVNNVCFKLLTIPKSWKYTAKFRQFNFVLNSET